MIGFTAHRSTVDRVDRGARIQRGELGHYKTSRRPLRGQGCQQIPLARPTVFSAGWCARQRQRPASWSPIRMRSGQTIRAASCTASDSPFRSAKANLFLSVRTIFEHRAIPPARSASSISEPIKAGPTRTKMRTNSADLAPAPPAPPPHPAA
jgi:hypothetical protein